MERTSGSRGASEAGAAGGDARTPGRPRPARWVGAAVFALTVCAFLPALANEFVDWDDDVNFLRNVHYRGFGAEQLRWMFTTFYVGHYMPLTWLSCALDHAVWGMDPRGYHLTNLLLHAATAVLLYGALRALLRVAAPTASVRAGALAAAAGALSWSLHPLRVESVAWATERRDVLAGLLVVGALRAYVARFGARFGPNGAARGAYGLALLLFGLSLFAKTAAVALPLVLLLLDAWPLRRLGRAALVEKLPFLALTALGVVLAWRGQVESTTALVTLDDYPLSRRLAQAGWSVAFYVQKTLLPVGLSPFYWLDRGLDPLSAPFVVRGALALAATCAALALRRRAPLFAVAWFGYLLLVAPFVGLTQAGMQSAADRYAYFAALPFAGVGAWAALRLGARPAGAAAVVVVLAALGALSFRQTTFWRDSATLWTRVVDVDPAHAVGLHRRGVALHRVGRYAEAVEAYERSLELRPGRDDTNARYDLSLSRLALGEVAEARDELARVLAADPTHPGALRVWTDVALDAGRPGDAVAAWEDALAAAPRDASVRRGLGSVLLREGRWAEAERHLRFAVEEEPGSAEGWTGLGVCLAEQGRSAEAAEALRRALDARPDHDPARRAAERYGLGVPPGPVRSPGPAGTTGSGGAE